MSEQHAETDNNALAVPTRLTMNRLGPPKVSFASLSRKVSDHPVNKVDHGAQTHFDPKRLTEDRARARTLARAQALAERLSTAADEVASAVTEATRAVEEMEETTQAIAAGADQALAAAEESRAAINQIEKAADSANGRAEASLRRVTESQALARLAMADIEILIRGVRETADANIEFAKTIGELERESGEIGKIVHAVTAIADQTSLLSLNAAIEAARAGEHGKGFAVVADAVGNLAEISERSARGIQEVVNRIRSQIKMVAEGVEAAAGRSREEVEKADAITRELSGVVRDFDRIATHCAEIRKNSAEALAGVKDYLKGAEEIASAAEESTAACQEVQKSTQEQSRAHSELNDASRSLAELAEVLRTSTSSQKSSEELAAAAEELSANAGELKSSSRQISVAVGQISKAAADQARATEDSNALGAQIRQAARAMGNSAGLCVEKALATQSTLALSRANVDALILDVEKSADASGRAAKDILDLEEQASRVDQIVDAIVMVTVQTKMLAVNGNVEAARAGEFGSGFSVVARDIKSLANESSENADRIKQLVRGVQRRITRVAAEIELAVRRGREEVARTRVSTASLDRIAVESESIVRDIRDVSNVAAEVAAGLEQAGKASQQIAVAAEETARASANAAAASDQSLKAADQIAQAIEEIAARADELQNG